MLRTGDLVQEVVSVDGAVATGTTTIPNDDTIPAITEGDEYLSQVITPLSNTNVLVIQANLAGMAHSAGGVFTTALFQDAVTNALAVVSKDIPTINQRHPTDNLIHTMLAGTIAATTLRIRAGSGTGGTTTVNGVSAGRQYGGVYNSYLKITEIFT